MILLNNETARKELFILSIALLIEVTRMLLVDIFVLRDYFSGRSYSIFRAPLPCENEDGWCTAAGPAGPDARYFYGVSADAFNPDPSRCKCGISVPELHVCTRAQLRTQRLLPVVVLQGHHGYWTHRHNLQLRLCSHG